MKAKKRKRNPAKLFSENQLAKLRAEYAKVVEVDPLDASYNKLIRLLSSLTQAQLKQLAQAKIPFVSRLAHNRVIHKNPAKKRKRNPITERGVIQKLIRFLKSKDFNLVSVDDGGEVFKNPSEKTALDAVFSVGESWMRFQREGFKPHTVYIVLGNEPDEVISDWSFSEGDPDGFDKTMDNFTNNISSPFSANPSRKRNPGKFAKGERVQLHAATDSWMRGDKYGVVVGYGIKRKYRDSQTGEIVDVRPVRVKLDKSGKTKRFHPDNIFPI